MIVNAAGHLQPADGGGGRLHRSTTHCLPRSAGGRGRVDEFFVLHRASKHPRPVRIQRARPFGHFLPGRPNRPGDPDPGTTSAKANRASGKSASPRMCMQSDPSPTAFGPANNGAEPTRELRRPGRKQVGGRLHSEMNQALFPKDSVSAIVNVALHVCCPSVAKLDA